MSRYLVNLESVFGDLESRYRPDDGMADSPTGMARGVRHHKLFRLGRENPVPPRGRNFELVCSDPRQLECATASHRIAQGPIGGRSKLDLDAVEPSFQSTDRPANHTGGLDPQALMGLDEFQ